MKIDIFFGIHLECRFITVFLITFLSDLLTLEQSVQTKQKKRSNLCVFTGTTMCPRSCSSSSMRFENLSGYISDRQHIFQFLNNKRGYDSKHVGF